jgi:CRP/FNR family transcriptional regulator, cyclic AMP receptor protein
MGNTPARINLTLPETLSARLFDQARKVPLNAGQTLFLAGDPGDGCYWVDEGLLKVHVISLSGRDRILAILGAGTIVGELSMFDGAPRSASVTAIRASKLSFVSRATFDGVLHAHPEIYRELTIILARRLRDIDDAIAATSFLSVRGRAARVLLALVDAFGQDVGDGRIVIRQKVTQSDIAAMAGIVRENFSRVMHDWLDRAFVSRNAGYYCVENKSVLEHESDF